ncbi:uncharacterized protein HKW66_Vig0044940 [Vigna angularis]|uniref:Transcription and mRNA export factor ENY2 n=1 Tax=Phaseolus angularis TaxID=3914 RepID=A0A8T0L0J1_PHAAN|nr:uncharacterized protein HKW66_Vig0044940 [Vigna angularis]
MAVKLIETGEKERLMELLRERLVDCGWKDEMKALCSLLYFHAIALSYSTTLKSVLVHATVNAAGNELLHPVGIEHAFPQCVRTRFVTMILFSLQRDFLGSSFPGYLLSIHASIVPKQLASTMVGDIVSHEGAEREDPTTVMFLLTVIVRRGLHNVNVLASGTQVSTPSKPLLLIQASQLPVNFQQPLIAVVKKKGRNNVTVDELVHVITPKGRASVPDTIKAELLQRIRTFLVSAAL